MPTMNLSHFEATVLFALLISVVLGVTGRRTDRERFLYALRCFGYFLITIFGLGWLMYFAHG